MAPLSRLSWCISVSPAGLGWKRGGKRRETSAEVEGDGLRAMGGWDHSR